MTMSDNPVQDMIDHINNQPYQPVPKGYQTLDEMMDKAKEYAEFVLVDEGSDAELVPTWCLIPSNGHPVVMGTPFLHGTAGKDMVAMAMKIVMKEIRCVRYTFVSEAWTVEAKSRKEAFDDSRPPSERDDRIEIVLVTGGERDKNVTDTYQIIRDWDTGAVTELKPHHDRMESDSAEGRFCNLLEDV